MSLKELLYILKSISASDIIRKNEKEMFDYIPKLEDCKGFDQHNEWHIYDVYEHTLHVVDYIRKDNKTKNKEKRENDYEILKLSALFHDLGKPETFELDKYGIGHFPLHNKVSKRIFHDFIKDKEYDEKNIKIISKLIDYHDENFAKLDKKTLSDTLYKFTIEELILLYKLKRADLLAQNKKFHYLLKDYDKQEKRLILLKKGDNNE